MLKAIAKFFRGTSEEAPYTGRRVYKQLAVTPEAHARILKMADDKGKSIIDTVDRLAGVK